MYNSKAISEEIAFELNFELNSSLNLVGAQAGCANIHMFYVAVVHNLNPSYVGLPSSVCTSVGVGNLDTEGYAFSANFTFSHSFIHPFRPSFKMAKLF